MAERRIDSLDRAVDRGPSEQVQAKRLVIGTDDFASISPFLRFSEDWFAAPGGFETHPHRGMQTVTLVLEGALHHTDHTGADGVLRAGDVQWMTAGRGVLHSEMPYRRELAHTLQLWLNLPAAAKMAPARYVDQPLAKVPVRRLPGVEARIYAGRSGDIAQPHGSDWPMMMIDLRVDAGHSFVVEVPAGYRGFLYVLDGSARLGSEGTAAEAPQVAWFEPRLASGDEVDTVTVAAQTAFRAIVCAGPPIDEPVVAYGPFVMNTVEEIRQAFIDYQTDRLTA